MWNFPDSPSAGQIFTTPNGAQYIYTDGVWKQSSAAQIKLPASGPNLIVNPGFEISQETPLTEVTVNATYFADQWYVASSGLGTFGAGQQTADSYYYGYLLNKQAQASVAAGAYMIVNQKIEGIQMRDLRWGKADAIPAVLSFEAQCLTTSGTFSATIQQIDGSHAFAYDFPLVAGEDWKKFSVAIPAQTAGDWKLAAGNAACTLIFALAAGSTFKAPSLGWNAGNYVAGPGLTNNAVAANGQLRIRRVQLRADPLGSGVNPPYQGRTWEEELLRCQRYYQQDQQASAILGGGSYTTSTTWYADVQFACTMRTVPTVSVVQSSATNANAPAFGSASTSAFRWSASAPAAGNMFSLMNWKANARM